MWQSSQLRSLVATQIFCYIIFQFQAFPQLGLSSGIFSKVPKHCPVCHLPGWPRILDTDSGTRTCVGQEHHPTPGLWHLRDGGKHRGLNADDPNTLTSYKCLSAIAGVYSAFLGECSLDSSRKFHCLSFSKE